MPKEFHPQRLDIKAFAEEGGQLAGQEKVGTCERLMAETQGRGADLPLNWSASGEIRNPRHVHPQIWLHLKAEGRLPLTCQRCLHPVDVPVSVDRSFRFVADEATAAAEDDEAEEDLLVLSRSFDLMELIEDELLMELPVAPRHDVCPETLPVSASDPAFEEEEAPRENPFAVLGKLRKNGH